MGVGVKRGGATLGVATSNSRPSFTRVNSTGVPHSTSLLAASARRPWVTAASTEYPEASAP